METKATNLAAITDQSLNQQPQQHPAPPESAPRAARVVEGAEDQADIRLIIEELDGSYVYKTVDRRTGDIVAQYPREELLKMREEDDYAAGAVISAKI